jgi:hypothetical protein
MEEDKKRSNFVMHFGFIHGLCLVGSGGMTIVVDDNKNLGYAICSPQDNFCRKIGREKAIKELQENPFYLEEYNPEWTYQEKIDYLVPVANDILKAGGGHRWKNKFDLVPRKQKFFTLIDLNNLPYDHFMNIFNDEKEKKENFFGKMLNKILGR